MEGAGILIFVLFFPGASGKVGEDHRRPTQGDRLLGKVGNSHPGSSIIDIDGHIIAIHNAIKECTINQTVHTAMATLDTAFLISFPNGMIIFFAVIVDIIPAGDAIPVFFGLLIAFKEEGFANIVIIGLSTMYFQAARIEAGKGGI